jgi:hypothetical protein
LNIINNEASNGNKNCQLCANTGHTADRCQSIQEMMFAQCQFCRARGHIAKHCKKIYVHIGKNEYLDYNTVKRNIARNEFILRRFKKRRNCK